ncbi:MAG: sulfatase-like hydrolase/transferase [Armatimonadota bacterium]
MSSKALILATDAIRQLYYTHTKAFLENAKSSRKPFFLMANSQDPHRPFPNGEQAGGKSHAHNVSRIYKAEEVEVPGFLPQGIPDIKREIAQYYAAVHRCDETVGQVLRALKETGFEDSTIVIFLSDNGISVPFAKTNCYEASTKTPLIIKWPGKVKPGKVDHEHFVSGTDLMPTLIEALELPAVEGMDGRSFLEVLKGKKLPGRDKVFTFITSTSARKFYPMRSVRTATRSYIFNAWSDDKTEFRNEAMSGLTWKAMVEAGKADPKIAARCNFYLYRVREEFYNLEDDPFELNNLISSPEHREEIDQLRAGLLEMMKETSDPLLNEFRRQIGA